MLINSNCLFSRLVLATLYSVYTQARSPPVRCLTGHKTTENYWLNYTVKPTEESDDNGDEAVLFPRAPTNLHINPNGSNVSITWKTPNDTSAKYLNGFRVEVWIKEINTFDNIISYIEPVVVYKITFKQTPESNITGPEPLIRRAVFSLQCSTSLPLPATVTFILISLPMGDTNCVSNATIRLEPIMTQTTTTTTQFTSTKLVSVIANKRREFPSNDTIINVVEVGGVVVIGSLIGVYIFKRYRKRQAANKSKYSSTTSEDMHVIGHRQPANNSTGCREPANNSIGCKEPANISVGQRKPANNSVGCKSLPNNYCQYISDNIQEVDKNDVNIPEYLRIEIIKLNADKFS